MYNSILEVLEEDEEEVVVEEVKKQEDCMFRRIMPQVSIHVAATHQTSQHQTLKSQIQMVGP